MKTPIPDPETALAEMAELRPLLYEAFEVGTQVAREHFATTEASFDPWMFAHLTRFHAKQHLIRLGYPVSDTGDGHSLEEIPYSGLWLRFQARERLYQIRIFKSHYGDTPSPGNSAIKQRYYQQLPVGVELTEEQQKAVVNLLVLWDVNGLHTLTGLSLVCPRNGNAAQSSVELFWSVPIPHPALSVSGHRGPSVDLDLPIERKTTEGEIADRKEVGGTE